MNCIWPSGPQFPMLPFHQHEQGGTLRLVPGRPQSESCASTSGLGCGHGEGMSIMGFQGAPPAATPAETAASLPSWGGAPPGRLNARAEPSGGV